MKINANLLQLKRALSRSLQRTFAGNSSAEVPEFAGKLHGFPVELNKGNRYPLIASVHSLFNAPLVELVHNRFQNLGRAINMIDVGAAVGDTVLLLEQRCKGKVNEYLCVDGDAEFFSLLEKNVRQFPNVSVVQAMLAGEAMEVKELVKHHSASAGCFGSRRVTATTLDSIVRERGFVPDVLKIDVDGFDGEVLRGAEKVLETRDLTVIFEWHPQLYSNAGQDFKRPFSVLSKAGFQTLAWFDNRGEFRHFSSSKDESSVSLMNTFLLSVNHVRDQHFDIIAFRNCSEKDMLDLARLSYAREMAVKYSVL